MVQSNQLRLHNQPKGKSMKKTVILLVLMSLGACDYRANWGNEANMACYNYGFKTGTPQFAQCVQNEMLAKQQKVANYFATRRW